MNEKIVKARDDLLAIYHAGLAAVAGRDAIRRALLDDPVDSPVHLVAIGKAAVAMYRGALDALGDEGIATALVITKEGYGEPLQNAVLMEAGHPWPTQASLDAGQALLAFIRRAPAEARFLFLISGGASSLVEVLPDGVTLATLRRLNDWLLASGLDIHAMNHVRKAVSSIKGGRLARQLRGRPARVLMISDVPGDEPASIGSGMLVAEREPETELTLALPEWVEALMAQGPPRPSPSDPAFAAIELDIVASLDDAKRAAADRARRLGYEVFEEAAFIGGDALVVGRRLASELLLSSRPGLFIWGGETTINLPPEPGRGGRNQALALAAAAELEGRDDVALLAAGTDGSDGPTEEAGALIDGGTVARGEAGGQHLDECLAGADAGTFLAASGDLIRTGPTGTNVMDLMLGLRL